MRVRTVVVDTNLFGSGNFSEKVLKHLVPLAEAGNHIVVPEPVVWEWAEHAHTLLHGAVSTHAHAVDNVDKSLLERATVGRDGAISAFAPMNTEVVSAEAIADEIAFDRHKASSIAQL